MKKAFKIILKVLSSIIILMIVVPIVLSVILQIEAVQNFAVSKVTKTLSQKSGTNISISRVNIDFFNKLHIRGAYVEDYTGDTLLYVDDLRVGIEGINFFTGTVALGKVELTDGQLNLRKDSTDMMNISRLLQSFKSAKPTEDEGKGGDFRLSVKDISINNFYFTLSDHKSGKNRDGVNFKDLCIHDINIHLRNIKVHNDQIRGELENISLEDHSGFLLNRLSSPHFAVGSTGMRFEHLSLATTDSNLKFAHIYLLYDNWSAYQDFITKVTLDVEISPSKLNYRTLSRFMRQRSSAHTTVELSGKIRGTISDLHGVLDRVATNNTTLSTEFSIQGLPDIEQTHFTISLDNLTTDGGDIAMLYNNFTGGSLENILPLMGRQGLIQVDGTFQGQLSNFHTTAEVTTEQGVINASLIVVPRHGNNPTVMTGRVHTVNSFNLGHTLNIADIGAIVWDANVDITMLQDSTSILARAEIPLLQLKGYNYSNISIDGRFQGKTYEGAINIDDPNCQFFTRGVFDLSGEVARYDFLMDLQRADLVALGFNPRDSISILSTRFESTGSGTTLDNLNGELLVDRLTYVNHVDSISIGKMELAVHNSDSLKQVTLTSNLVDMEINGTTSYKEFINYLSFAMGKYLPAYPEAEGLITATGVAPPPKTTRLTTAQQEAFSEGYYHIKLNVKRANNVASIFVPGLQLATGTTLDFYIDPKKDRIGLLLESEFIGTMDNYLYRLRFLGYNRNDTLKFRLNAEEVESDGIFIPNIELRSNIANNNIELTAKFHNPSDSSMLSLNTLTSIYRTKENMPQIKVAFKESYFGIHSNLWELSPSYLLIDSTGVTINSLSLINGAQQFHIDGHIGRKHSDRVTLKLKDIDLAPASMFLSDLGYKLDGRLSGEAHGYALMGAIAFDAGLNFDSLKLNNHQLGSPDITSVWDGEQKRINFHLINDKKERPIYGFYDIPNKHYSVNIKFPELDMNIIEPLLSGILSDTRGMASADLVLSGVGKKGPDLAGEIEIKEYAFMVDFTKVRYKINGGVVAVKNSCFEAKRLPLTDGFKGRGVADFSLTSNYFKNIQFAVSARFMNLRVLNTSIIDNDDFYGRANATGRFEIKSSELTTNMTIVAETEENSEIYLPFTGVSSIEEASFITYIGPSGNRESRPRKLFRETVKKVTYSNDLDIKVDLTVKPNTKASINMVSNQLVMGGELMGNSIEARGDGRFNMHINPDQEIFTMTGNYSIERGKYFLQLFGSIFGKEMSISPKSTLIWSGDPADPEFNIEAVYKVKTSLASLSADGFTGASGSTNLDCGIRLSGRMSSPATTFSITATSADPEKQNLLRNILNTQEAINSQFFSLFLTGSFLPDAGSASMGSMGSSLASTMGAELISNQISNLISSDEVYIKLGYRPRTDYTSDEVNFGFETDIINNKLMLDVGASYNTRNNPTYNQISAFSADAYLTWVINRAETIRLQAFTRVIERLDEMQGLQETGVGIGFRQDFNSLKEFREEWRARRRAKEREQLYKKRRAEREMQEKIDSENRYRDATDSAGIQLKKRYDIDTLEHKNDPVIDSIRDEVNLNSDSTDFDTLTFHRFTILPHTRGRTGK